MGLWTAATCEPWDAALASYAAAILARGGERLQALDAWVHGDLPSLARARQPAYVSRDELLELIRWKMHRGVWRANNLQLAASNPADAVEACTREALRSAASVPPPAAADAGADGAPATASALLAPVRTLARLKGLGPATASAVLAAVHPERFPFLEDVVAEAVPDLGPPAFTPRYYAAYALALRARAAALAVACPNGGWTPNAVDRALWASRQGQ